MRIANVLGGLLARRSRRAAQGGGQEDQGADPGGAGRGSSSARWRAGHDRQRHRGHRGPDRDLRPLRVQQVARGRLLHPLLPDRMAQGALPGGVPGGAAVVARSATPTTWCEYINEARELGLEVLAARRERVAASSSPSWATGGSASASARSRMWARARSRPSSPAAQTGRYRSLVELCDRIDLRLCNKRVLEALIDAGACDSLGGHRAQLVAALEHAFGEAQARQCERDVGPARRCSASTPPPPPPVPRSPTCRPGPSRSGSPGRKRSWASSFPGTPSPSTARRWSFSGPGRRRRWGPGATRRSRSPRWSRW